MPRLFTGLLLAAFALGAGKSAAWADDAAQLKQIRARIEALQEKLNDTRDQRDSLREEIRGLDRRIGRWVNELRATEGQMRAEGKRLDELTARRARERRRLADQRDRFQRQLVTAYILGRDDTVKMVFHQKNPAQVTRVMTYYRYLNQARTERIDQLRTDLAQLQTLEQQLQARRQDLERLRDRQQGQKRELETARARRGELLASLNRQVRSQSHEIERLRSDEKRLEQLVDELKSVWPQAPGPQTSFANLRGRLPLPAPGRILARYGSSKNVGHLKWRGLLIAGHEGQEARAVFRGRVVFADWLRGFGLLLILDHGDGYMTLYGYNQSLRKNVGDWVEAGEPIATLGNTGDSPEPGLYFEIRHNGEPRDPLVWCKTR